MTLKLTINSGVHSDTLVTACKNFTWNRDGITYTSSGNHDFFFTNAQGCQDTVTLKLTINSGVHTDTLVTACKNFTWNRDGVTYTSSGNHDFFLTKNQVGQDTVTLKLTINSGVHTDTLVTACKNFTWNRDGVTYTSSGNHNFFFTNAQGCQDTVTLKLTINSGVHTDTLVTACKTFTWNRDGVTYTSSGNHDFFFTNAQGCQDTVTLKLAINSGVHTDTLVTACKTFTWNRDGVTYTSSGNHDFFFTNAQGCQDTVTLKLTINSGVHTDTLVTACKTFTWNRDGVTYTSSGNHDFFFTNAQGCQDTVTLKLAINSGVHTDTLVTACKTFTWNRDGVTYTSSGNHDFFFTNAQGCQDTVTLKLTINSGVHTDTLVTACKSFTWNRDEMGSASCSNHDFFFTNAQGWKDTFTLKLTINSRVHTDTLVTACKNFTWNRDGVTYTSSGNHDFFFTNAQGCQDTVTLKLTINSGVHADTMVTACKTFTWNRDGVAYNSYGNHDFFFINAQGCQDTVTLKLTINSGVHSDTTLRSSDLFTWNRDGVTYTSSGNHDFIFTNAQGCQDTVTLKLTINSGVHTDTTVVACKTFTWNRDGVTYNSSGNHGFIFTNAQGCQDTVTLKLTINSGIHTDTTVVACKTFTWNRNNVTYTSAATVDYI